MEVSLEQNRVLDQNLDQNRTLDRVLDASWEQNRVLDRDPEQNRVLDQNLEQNQSLDRVLDQNLEQNRALDASWEQNRVLDRSLEQNRVPDRSLEQNRVPDRALEQNRVPDRSLEQNRVPDRALEQNRALEAHSRLLLAQLNGQREFGFLCDCTVAIGNVYFKAHRAVLAAFSNYFKMIFIHQSSECIKIQPADIQPDVFSYLLHIMYTGQRPPQALEAARLQEGIRFLHAPHLGRPPPSPAPPASRPRPPAPRPRPPASRLRPPAPGRPADVQPVRDPDLLPAGQQSGAWWAEPRRAPLLAPPPPPPGAVCSVASGGDPDLSIKQERPEEDGEEGAGLTAYGLRSSPEGLREHLVGHAPLAAIGHAPLAAIGHAPLAAIGHAPRPGGGCLEEALRQSQALAAQLAAELRRSRGDGVSPAPFGGGGVSPAPFGVGGELLAARKRRVACAVCGLRCAHKSQLQQHMYAHTGRRHGRHGGGGARGQGGGARGEGGGANGGEGGGAQEANRDAQDNGSSCYSLDSEGSQGSADGAPLE
ncbi:LOW QUALITY PROTEIN: uncharacterized protein zbtb25 [Menidia menidia]